MASPAQPDPNATTTTPSTTVTRKRRRDDAGDDASDDRSSVDAPATVAAGPASGADESKAGGDECAHKCQTTSEAHAVKRTSAVTSLVDILKLGASGKLPANSVTVWSGKGGTHGTDSVWVAKTLEDASDSVDARGAIADIMRGLQDEQEIVTIETFRDPFLLDILRIDGKGLLTEEQRRKVESHTWEFRYEYLPGRGSLARDVLRQLWGQCVPSGFGDLKAQTTRVDRRVHDSRELPKERTVTGLLDNAVFTAAVDSVLTRR